MQPATVSYPQAALHTRARELRDGADAVAGYERLLRSAVTRGAYEPGSACVELSGGLDSANVAATLAVLHPGQVTASAMMILGEPDIQHRPAIDCGCFTRKVNTVPA